MVKKTYEEKLQLKMMSIFLPLTKKPSVKEALELWKIVLEIDKEGRAQVAFEDREGKVVP